MILPRPIDDHGRVVDPDVLGDLRFWRLMCLALAALLLIVGLQLGRCANERRALMRELGYLQGAQQAAYVEIRELARRLQTNGLINGDAPEAGASP
ncbi:MAG: hypothetical protein ACE5I3_13605 [Phycisphaerae bacterium]